MFEGFVFLSARWSQVHACVKCARLARLAKSLSGHAQPGRSKQDSVECSQRTLHGESQTSHSESTVPSRSYDAVLDTCRPACQLGKVNQQLTTAPTAAPEGSSADTTVQQYRFRSFVCKMGRTVPWICWQEWYCVRDWLLSQSRGDIARGIRRVCFFMRR